MDTISKANRHFMLKHFKFIYIIYIYISVNVRLIDEVMCKTTHISITESYFFLLFRWFLNRFMK